MLTLIAAGCWAVYTVFGATILRRHSPLVTTTWAILAGTLFIAPVGIAQLATATCHGFGLPIVLAILYSGTLAAGVANVVIFHAVKLLGPTRVTALQFLVPPLAVVMAAIFLPSRSARSRSSAARSSWPASPSCGAARGRADGRPPGLGVGLRDRRSRSDADAPAATGAAPPVPPLLPGEPPLAILVDYDGTVALTDVSDTVMAEHVPGIWETEVAAYDAGRMGSRRLMELEMALVDAPPADLLATAAAQPHDPGFVPFVRRAQAAGIPVEIVSDGFGFFIEPALEALGVGELPVVTARTTFEGRRAVDRLPQRPPDLPRVRDLQAQPRARAPGRRPGRGLHRRRRERPLRRRLQRRRLGQALARPDLHRGGLAVQALDGVPRDRLVAGEHAGGLAHRIRRRCRCRARGRSSAARRSGATASSIRRRGRGRRLRR